MKEEYNKLFKKAASRMSDEELLRAVLDSGKAENMSDNKQKRTGKAVFVPVIAAAAVAAMSMGAGAVYSRSVKDDYVNALEQDANVFPQKFEDEDGAAASLKDKTLESDVYEQLNVELEASFDCGDFTLEFPGAMSDGNIIYVMYNVVFNEEPKLEYGDIMLYLESESCTDDVYYLPTLSMGTFEKRGGKTVYSSYLVYSTDDELTKPLNIHLWQLWSPSASMIYDLNIDMEIPVGSDLKKSNKTVDVPTSPYVDLGEWGGWNLDKIKITSFGVTFEASTGGATPDPAVCKFYRAEFPVIVTFKDGSTLRMELPQMAGIDAGRKTFNAKYIFNYPINVEDIETVQCANAVVDMNGNVIAT